MFMDLFRSHVQLFNPVPVSRKEEIIGIDLGLTYQSQELVGVMLHSRRKREKGVQSREIILSTGEHNPNKGEIL